MRKLRDHQHGHKQGLVGNLTTVAEYGIASGAAAYYLAAYPGRQRVHVAGRSLPTLPFAGVTAKLASLAITQFHALSMLRKLRPYLDVAGNAWLGLYVASLASAKAFEKSGQARVLVSQGDVDKIRKASPTATILGVAQMAPPGKVLSADDIANIARRIK